MKTLFFDLKHGVSGDMVLEALIQMTDDPDSIRYRIKDIVRSIDEMTAEGNTSQEHEDDHGHSHFHRSYGSVLEIIDSLDIDPEVERGAKDIYKVIAEAESKVHGSTMEDLHFHEVGRNRAIANITGVALCIRSIGADRIIYEKICDGIGTVECAHGTLSVPVPAVKAMLDKYSVTYAQTDHEGEMVTPSGLAIIIGIHSKPGKKPECDPLKCSEALGSRSVDGRGLKAYLYEEV